jgi:hypothetical protein
MHFKRRLSASAYEKSKAHSLAFLKVLNGKSSLMRGYLGFSLNAKFWFWFRIKKRFDNLCCGPDTSNVGAAILLPDFRNFLYCMQFDIGYARVYKVS